MSKKGQETGINPLILLLIGAIVLVVIVYGFIKGYGYFTDKVEFLPDSPQVASTACNLAATIGSLEFRDNYCTKLHKLKSDGQDHYFTCWYLVENEYISAGSIKNNLPLCEAPNYDRLCELRLNPTIKEINNIDCPGTGAEKSCKDKPGATACVQVPVADCTKQLGCAIDSKEDDLITNDGCKDSSDAGATACKDLTSGQCGATAANPQYGCEWA